MAQNNEISDQVKIFTDVAVTLIEDTAKSTWGKVKKFFRDLNAQDSIRYGTAYEEYLDNVTEKYRKIKTIIYRHSPRKLESFYIPMNVRNRRRTISSKSIATFLDISHKLLITGTGGIGKSMMLRYLFINTQRDADYIPVLIELRNLNNIDQKDISLYQSVFKALTDNGFTLEEEYFEYSMKEGAYVIFLDGYDEVNRDLFHKVTEEIKALSSKYNGNYYIVSSRPSTEFIGWNDYHEISIEPLSKEQALELVQKIDFDESTKKIFCEQLEVSLYEKYRSFASNPLLLNIMLLTFQKHSSIPDRLNDFYDEAFVTLFNVHDATKDSYIRDIRCGLGCEDFKLIFAYICFKSYFSEEYQFTDTTLKQYISAAQKKFPRISFRASDFQDDLLMSVCMIVKDGLDYRFSHRSFQEYFAAWYTCKLLDEEQSKLLLQWIKESPNILSDSYFSMLYDLQSDKVNKIVLIPILKELQKLYSTHGFSLALLKVLFGGVLWKTFADSKGKSVYHLTLEINNPYLCRGLMLNSRLNHYQPRTSSNEQEAETALAIELQKKDPRLASTTYMRFPFEEVLTIISEDELLRIFSYVKDDIDFAMKIISEHDTPGVNRKKKVASILDEL